MKHLGSLINCFYYLSESLILCLISHLILNLLLIICLTFFSFFFNKLDLTLSEIIYTFREYTTNYTALKSS